MGTKNGTDWEADLIREYAHWEYLREHGGSDPFYDDAVNMELTRNHIIYAKRQIEEKYGEDREKYPEIYFRELPPEAAKGYMANAAEIRDRAAEVLDSYLADANFRYLLCNKDFLTKNEAEKISIGNVLNYAAGLAAALRNDDLISMRRYTVKPESYLESFAGCAEKVRRILSKKKMVPSEENSQMTLFQMGMETGQCH